VISSLRCRFSPLAEADLENIALAIAIDSPNRALSFIGEIRQHCLVVAQNPLAYRLRKEYGPDIRVTVYGQYLIFHRGRDEALMIERILHGARHRAWIAR
jgi:toxin ParE1/3/4